MRTQSIVNSRCDPFPWLDQPITSAWWTGLEYSWRFHLFSTMYISCISVSNWWLCGRISLIVSQKYHCNESDGDSSFFKSPGCSDSDSFLKCIRIAVTVIVFSKVQVAWKDSDDERCWAAALNCEREPGRSCCVLSTLLQLLLVPPLLLLVER